MVFPIKKFAAWFADLKGKKVTVEDMARWGYSQGFSDGVEFWRQSKLAAFKELKEAKQ
jgi:hypothetical protein